MAKTTWVAKNEQGEIIYKGSRREVENYLYGRRTYEGVWTDTREKVEE